MVKLELSYADITVIVVALEDRALNLRSQAATFGEAGFTDSATKLVNLAHSCEELRKRLM